MQAQLGTTMAGATWVESFAGWEGPAQAGGTTLTFSPQGDFVRSPVFHLTGFAPAGVTTVTVNGAPQVAGTGYFATKDSADGSLWLTLNGTVRGVLGAGGNATVRIE
jgi:hypothetical protein